MTKSRDRILALIQDKPKHYSKMIQRDPVLKDWVMNHTLVQSDRFAEMIYSALHQKSNICSRGNVQKFAGYAQGYTGCGLPNACACAREAVSASVKAAKSAVTQEQQALTNDRRRATNLERYGVICTGQLDKAKALHQEFYADQDKVHEVQARIIQTNRERYGVDNARHVPEIEQRRKDTILERFGFEHAAQHPDIKQTLKEHGLKRAANGEMLTHGYNKFKKFVENKYNFTVLTTREEYTGSNNGSKLKFACNQCNRTLTKKFHYGVGLNCPVCNPRAPAFVSGEEQAVYDYITQGLGIAGRQGDRDLIAPWELDMVFDDHRIAVEYCGLYWHSELSSGKGRAYHRDKMLRVEQAGYRLITIFSDEWMYRADVVRSRLAHVFGRNDRRVYARALTVRAVSSAQSRAFQEQHHIQGASQARVHLGLYDQDDQLRALQTFSAGRKALNTQSRPDHYELVRYVTDGSAVIGGASRLLRHFVREYNPVQIVSYADLRWSQGNLYEQLGFVRQPTPSIGYWYVPDYLIREHRYNHTKAALVRAGAPVNLTEWQIMQDLDYDRIWDCGHAKFVWTRP